MVSLATSAPAAQHVGLKENETRRQSDRMGDTDEEESAGQQETEPAG